MADDDKPAAVDAILDTPELADALESEQFRRFLDHIPIAIAVAELAETERVIYANPNFERLSGLTAARLESNDWSVVDGQSSDGDDDRTLASAIVAQTDSIGVFSLRRGSDEPAVVEVFSNVIATDEGHPAFRLVALVELGAGGREELAELRERIRTKDTLLREIQHRVRNNLQMIIALIRLEERNTALPQPDATFNRLAGRVEAIQVLYDQLEIDSTEDEVDLGGYLGQIASAVMRAHATEGVRLEMRLDSYNVPVSTALPTGLVVNELITNALKHAFDDQGGLITLHCVSDGDGSRVLVIDNGAGLPEGYIWPKRGKLASLIVQSLRENANADLTVESTPGHGTQVAIVFRRSPGVD